MNQKIIDGIECFAPELALENSGFHPEALTILSEMERKNFWYISRNEILKKIFKRYLGNEKKTVLEVGCGNGTVMRALFELDNLELTGADIYLSGVKFAKKQVPKVNFIQLDACNIPFENKFDAIGCFDVLEHIDNDELVMRQLNKGLKNNGILFITVPQYPWLWSEIDEIDRHKRRYTRSELKEKISNAGFQIVHINCFAFSVFPLTMASRFLRKRKKDELKQPVNNVDFPEINISATLNFILRFCMRLDEFLYDLRIPLPFGTSLVLVAIKNKE